MSYHNLTLSLDSLAYNQIDKWVKPEGEPNCFKKHILARGCHLGLVPATATTAIADTAIGLIAGIASIATVGKHAPTVNFAHRHLDGTRWIIAAPYIHFLQTINPEASFGEEQNLRKGFIAHYVRDFLKDVAKECSLSDNCLKRHVASRLTYVLLAIASLVTRIVDGIIGALVAVLSFLTLGKIESINNLAYGALQAPGFVQDLHYSIIRCINPWTARI